MKARSELSIVKHVLFGWVVTPVVLVAGFGLFTTLAGADQTEITAFVVLSGLFGVATGWILGLILFLINWGIRGWIDVVGAARQNFGRGSDEPMEQANEIDPGQAERLALAQESLGGSDDEYHAPIPHEEPVDPWGGTNPYGCCQHNADENGVMHHGSPDCQHPQVLAGRV